MLPRERFDPEFGLQWLGWGARAARARARRRRAHRHQPRAAARRAHARRAGWAAARRTSRSPRGPRELRSVAAAFNRMASDLDSMERERAMVLAGISHDLRTPLSRLRLALEMSGAEGGAAPRWSTDIEEIDAIIGQFLDFARGAERGEDAPGPARAARRNRAPLPRLGKKVSVTIGEATPFRSPAWRCAARSAT